MSEIFKFKKFDILQKNAAMKVGTDSMLLGSIMESKNAKTGLDLGAGTGVLSLMVAQQNEDILIDSIEKDKPSFQDCQYNFTQSIWSDRLTPISASYFSYSFGKKYDIIFSNPPFYLEKEKKTKNTNQLSKHMSLNEFKIFAALVVNNLSSNGKFWIIVPYKLFKLIDDNDLFKPLKINYLKIIHSKTDKLYSRVVIQFSFRHTKKTIHEMVLRNKDNSYTRDYIHLTNQFHYNKLG
ncbi:methyltransferase [Crocinitomicaceae bacterium]|nr:methyltransferase [Crocinitomicaceae bacterium]